MSKGGNGSHWEGCYESHHDCAVARIAALEAENERLKSLRGVCAFCQAEMPMETDLIVTHMMVCEKHPMHEIGKHVARLQAVADAARRELRCIDALRKDFGTKYPALAEATLLLGAALTVLDAFKRSG